MAAAGESARPFPAESSGGVLLTSAMLPRMTNSPAIRAHVIPSPPAAHPRTTATRGFT